MTKLRYLYKVTVRYPRKDGGLTRALTFRDFIDCIQDAAIIHDSYCLDGGVILNESVTLLN